jgi:hypothetical protein
MIYLDATIGSHFRMIQHTQVLLKFREIAVGEVDKTKEASYALCYASFGRLSVHDIDERSSIVQVKAALNSCKRIENDMASAKAVDERLDKVRTEIDRLRKIAIKREGLAQEAALLLDHQVASPAVNFVHMSVPDLEVLRCLYLVRLA